MPNFRYPPDWVDRYAIPDVYPRKTDPFRPMGILDAPAGTPGAGPSEAYAPGVDIYKDAITPPGVRPVAYQRASNLTLSVTDQPQAIQQGTFQCDAFLISVPSASLNSTFFGFGSGVSVTSGIEVQPGIPQFYSPTNIREQWELQRLLEALTAMMGVLIGLQTGQPAVPTPGKFMSPRVVLNAHDYYLLNNTGITQNVAIMLFNVPEMQ